MADRAINPNNLPKSSSQYVQRRGPLRSSNQVCSQERDERKRARERGRDSRNGHGAKTIATTTTRCTNNIGTTGIRLLGLISSR